MQTGLVDPYNYPFLKKDETMYLSTISNCPIMQQRMTSSPLSLNTIANHPSRRKTLRVQLRKYWFLIKLMKLVFIYLRSSSTYRVEIKFQIKLRTHFTTMTLKALNQSHMSSELSELSTHYAQCINYRLLPKLVWTQVKISWETPSALLILTRSVKLSLVIVVDKY